MTITADMTFGEIALLPEFAGFGEHLMLCRPSTWERMWNKPIVSHMNSDANPYETARVLRGLNPVSYTHLPLISSLLAMRMGEPTRSLSNCIRYASRVGPPSTRSSASAAPESSTIASITSKI